ncbi:MAG: EAL domain-containing protein [Roseiarcus sp.]
MNTELLPMWDRACLRLWRSSQGKLSDRVYADLISYLYKDSELPIAASAISTVSLMTLVAGVDQIGAMPLVAIPFLGVSLFRVRHAMIFERLSPDIRDRDSSLYGAHYAILTLSMSILIAIMTVMIMVYGSPLSAVAVTALGVTMASGSAARNASMPRLVKWQTSVVVLPIVCGLLIFTPGAIAKLVAILSLVFLKGMQKTASRIQEDTIEARQQRDRAIRMARHDGLTGLPNRSYFTELLAAELGAGGDVGILYIDLDDFKNVNDSQGHPAGDILLHLVAGRLTGLLDPKRGCVSRFGGDEFVLMTRDDPVAAAEEVLAAFRKPFSLPAGDVRIGCTIGVSTSAMSRTSVDLVKDADIALYAAKATGRQCFAIFDAGMEMAVREKALFETRLRAAVEACQITLHYQPIVDLKTLEIVGAEALARWTDAELGQVRPDIFIKAAEEIGLIETLGERLLLTACKESALWTKPVRVAVNISPIQFKNPDRLKAAIRRALAESGLPGSRLCIEITEGTMIDDFETVRKTMLEIKAMGVRLALDDFGSGYCSLSYLEQIPFDKIKVDRSLMLAAMKNRSQEIVIQMVARMAAELEAEIVVEGIEEQSQGIRMLQFGVTQAQGYLYGRPSADQSAYMDASASGEASSKRRA